MSTRSTSSPNLGASPAAVSEGGVKLRPSSLVSTRREGTRIFFRAENDHVRRRVQETLFRADQVIRDRPYHHEQPTPEPVTKARKRA